MPEYRLYNSNTIVSFPLIGTSTLGSFTTGLALAAADIKIAKSSADGTFATATTSTNTGTIIAGINAYQVSLTTSELSCQQLIVVLKDADGPAYRDQAIIIETYGNVSAMHEFNLGTANVGTVDFVATGTITEVTGIVSANVIQASGTNVAAGAGTLHVAVQGTIGTVNTVLTAATVLGGTIGVLTGIASANIIQVKGTAVPGTQGTLTVNAGGLTGTVDANIIQVLGTAAPGTQGTLTVNAGGLTGTIDANVIQILATAVVATAGTLTNVGTVGFAATGTMTTITNEVSANLVQFKGTAMTGTGGIIGSVDRVSTVINPVELPAVVIDANVVRVNGTDAPSTGGTLDVAVKGTIGTVNTALTAVTALGTVNADMVALNGSTTAAALLAHSARGVGSGTAAGTLSPTGLSSDLFTSTRDDSYNGGILVMIGGTGDLERTDITAYNGTTKQATVTALTTAPAAGQALILV